MTEQIRNRTEKARARLKAFCDAERVSQCELARRCKTSQGYIHDLMNGRRAPSDQMKATLARVTGQSPAFADWAPPEPIEVPT